jgi:prophage DNA circulation protein
MSNPLQAVGQTAGAAAAAGGVISGVGSALTGGAPSFWSQLRPASFRGVPFGVFGSEIRFGRRVAIHEYPYRDTVWVEDMGRHGRRISFSAFHVGDDVINQREAFIAACETAGPGELVHPTLGRLRNVSLIEPATAIERWDAGRVFEYVLVFMETGQRVFPAATNTTTQATGLAAGNADLAAAADLFNFIGSALLEGAEVVQGVASTANAWISKASSIVQTSTSLFNSLGNLAGSLGRFVGQYSTGGTPQTVATLPSAIQALAATSTVAQDDVSLAGTALVVSANSLGGASSASTSSFVMAAQQVAAAVLAAVSEPRTALLALADLATFQGPAAPSNGPVGTAIGTATTGAADTFRRAAAVALARASMTYQPVSVQDAAAIRDLVAGILGAEAQVAGNEMLDNTFATFIALRAAVVQDLNTRGANLPYVETVKVNQPLPSLVLAQRLYRDSTRADELVGEANPIHPAFMPLSFQALSE